MMAFLEVLLAYEFRILMTLQYTFVIGALETRLKSSEFQGSLIKLLTFMINLDECMNRLNTLY